MTRAIGWRQWRVRAQIALWRHGWAWPLAAAAMAGALALHLAVLLPLRQARVSLDTELAHALAAPPRSGPTPQSASAERALRTMLHEAPTATELLQQMTALAAAQQIQLPQGDYQQRLHPATGILQLQVNQPVRASYLRLRQYVESVLRTMPSVSLDQVAAQRESIGQTELEVRLRWSLWLAPSIAPEPAEPSARPAPAVTQAE